MQLWREYLEQYADKEGNTEGQTIVAAYHAVLVLTALSRILDRDSRFKEVINQRIAIFQEGRKQAEAYADCLLNASFSIYNSLNTLCHQMTEGNARAAQLIGDIDAQVRQSVGSAAPGARPSAALRAGFPLLGLITIALDDHQVMTEAIRHVEKRFASGASAAVSDEQHLLNALYRMVEMLQICALLTDAELRDQIDQIASRFKEEDQAQEVPLKIRNGFCRLFELGHLLASQVDAMV